MFRFEMSGLDKLNKKLQDLSKKAAQLDGNHSVPLTELLTNSFISRHTRFSSVDEMFEASGFKVDTQEDFDAIPREKLDAFIQSVSPFSGWQTMLQGAAREWTAKQLGL